MRNKVCFHLQEEQGPCFSLSCGGHEERSIREVGKGTCHDSKSPHRFLPSISDHWPPFQLESHVGCGVQSRELLTAQN